MGAAPGRYQINASQENEILCRMLDRGIDDMEERRELPYSSPPFIHAAHCPIVSIFIYCTMQKNF